MGREEVRRVANDAAIRLRDILPAVSISERGCSCRALGWFSVGEGLLNFAAVSFNPKCREWGHHVWRMDGAVNWRRKNPLPSAALLPPSPFLATLRLELEKCHNTNCGTLVWKRGDVEKSLWFWNYDVRCSFEWLWVVTHIYILPCAIYEWNIGLNRSFLFYY